MELSEIKNKNFLVMGLGLHGGGLSVSKFLLKYGASLVITDLKGEYELRESILELEPFKEKVRYVLGCHDENDFLKADIVIKNPGVRPNNKYLKLAKRIETDISLFLMFNKNPIIAVTGSKGKSTLSYLLYNVIKTKFLNSRLGGNMGISPLGFLEELDGESPIVLELSSWQLHDLKIDPIISIITNIYNDHQNSYLSFGDYIDDKANIFLNQTSGAIIVQDKAYINYFSKHKMSTKLFLFSEKLPLGFKEDIFYINNFNLYLNKDFIFQIEEDKISILISKLIAGAVAFILKLDLSEVLGVIKKFNGIPHRLELVKVLKNVSYYNDTASTIPDSTVMSVKSLKKTNNNIILITGGTDKVLDFSSFKEILSIVKHWVLLRGSATEKIIQFLNKNEVKYSLGNSLFECINFAKELANANDIILFSPASASFELFKNEFDRGNQFKNLVNDLN